MFLQRNVAGQVFTIPGTLRVIADGSAVTAGASLTWIKDGTSGAAAGTLTHVSDGGYTYQPTQGETDAKICGWILSKAAAIGLAGSIRTTNADPNDGRRLALTAFPNADANATGGLPANVIRGGTAQSGSANTIQLDAGASALDDFYIGCRVQIIAGTGAGQERGITVYVGANKTATVGTNWTTNPDNTSVFIILPARAFAFGGVVNTVTNSVTATLFNNGVDSNVLAQSACDKITSTIWKDLVSGSDFTVVGSIGKRIVDNLDATVSTIKAKTDKLTFDVSNNVLSTPQTEVTVVVNNDKTGYSLSAGGNTAVASSVWSTIMEAGFSAAQLLRGIARFSFAKSSGGGTPTIKFRDLADTKDSITATCTVAGNRTAMILDLN